MRHSVPSDEMKVRIQHLRGIVIAEAKVAVNGWSAHGLSGRYFMMFVGALTAGCAIAVPTLTIGLIVGGGSPAVVMYLLVCTTWLTYALLWTLRAVARLDARGYWIATAAAVGATLSGGAAALHTGSLIGRVNALATIAVGLQLLVYFVRRIRHTARPPSSGD